MQDWTRSELISLVALLVTMVAALAGIVVIQNKFWRTTLTISVILIVTGTVGILVNANLRAETPPIISADARTEYLRRNIIGKWYDPQRNSIQVFEFTETGNFTYAPNVNNKNIFTYKILDGDHMEVNLEGSIYRPFNLKGNPDLSKLALDVRLDSDNLVMIADPKSPLNVNLIDKTDTITLRLTRLPWYLRIVVFLDR